MAMYKFTYEDGDLYDENSHKVELTFYEEDGVTWSKLTRSYLDFLRGMGYVFNEQVVKEFIAETVSEIAGAEQNECN